MFSRHGYIDNKLCKKIKKTVLGDGLKIVKVSPVSASVGTNFIVSDDPVVAPMNSSSTVSLLSKLQLSIGDIEEHLISIGKNEVCCTSFYSSWLKKKISYFCFESICVAGNHHT